MREARRVAITGLGPISAVGIGREDFWQGLAEGREGRRAPERLAETTLPRLAECLDFAVEDYLESQKTYLDRCSAFTLAACALAFEDAGLDWRALGHPGVALSLGTAWGPAESWAAVTAKVLERGVRMASPVVFTHSFVNSPASLAAIEYSIQGPAATWCAGELSAAVALQYGLDLVRRGRAQVALAGGVEALSAPVLAALVAGGAKGVPGEGACLLVLEDLEAAQARGAGVLGELLEVDLAPEGGAADAQAAPAEIGACGGAQVALAAAAALRPGASADALVTVAERAADGRAARVVMQRWS